MAAIDRPEYDVPLICPDCIRTHGATPSQTRYPQASIYEFGYSPAGKRWRILFCCPEREEDFLRAFPVVTEDIKVIWRQDRKGPRGS